jgi:hypothetical protein
MTGSDQATELRSRCLVIVAGPGRSGTSLVTGLMGRLGFLVPQPEISPNATNPKGFGEPTWALSFHKRVMRSVGVDHGDTRPDAIDLVTGAAAGQAVLRELVEWLDDQFVISDRVVVKDPRLVWFAELYRAAAAQLGVGFGVVTMVRHPAETIRSADMAYGGLPVSTRTAGWINGALTTERTTRPMNRVLVEYEELMGDWRKTLEVVEERLGVEFTSRATAAQFADADDLLDVTLRRSHPGWADLGVPTALQDTAMQTYNALCTLTDLSADDTGPAAAAWRELDRLTDTYTSGYHTALDVVWSSTTAALAAERNRVVREFEAEAAPPTATLPGAPLLASARRLARRKRST